MPFPSEDGRASGRAPHLACTGRCLTHTRARSHRAPCVTRGRSSPDGQSTACSTSVMNSTVQFTFGVQALFLVGEGGPRARISRGTGDSTHASCIRQRAAGSGQWTASGQGVVGGSRGSCSSDDSHVSWESILATVLVTVTPTVL